MWGNARRLGSLAGMLLGWSFKRPSRVSCRELRAHDYRTSMQRVGVRFTERIRNVFRFRWLRKVR